MKIVEIRRWNNNAFIVRGEHIEVVPQHPIRMLVAKKTGMDPGEANKQTLIRCNGAAWSIIVMGMSLAVCFVGNKWFHFTFAEIFVCLTLALAALVAALILVGLMDSKRYRVPIREMSRQLALYSQHLNVPVKDLATWDAPTALMFRTLASARLMALAQIIIALQKLNTNVRAIKLAAHLRDDDFKPMFHDLAAVNLVQDSPESWASFFIN